MTVLGDRLRDRPWFERLKAARLVLAAAAAALVGLWATGFLTAGPATVTFLFVAIALLAGVGSSTQARTDAKPSERPTAGAISPILDSVLAGLPQPVIALDNEGHVVALNAPARTVAPSLRRGEPVSLALRVPEVLEAVRRAQATGDSQRVEFIDRVPVERWYEAIVMPVSLAATAAEPESWLVLVTLDDLTPLRRVEEMRADFVANASHELRTPLAALSGFIETLQGPARNDPDAQVRFLLIMHAQANRMARLIDDLLSLSRIELNAHLRPDKPVELPAIVRQVVDGLQMLARDREVAIDIDAAAERIDVLGDRDELTRVFENLIENAIKYAASGKRVDIKLAIVTAPNGTREAQVAIRDFGPGIAPEHLPRLTERFYRVDVVDSRAQGGTGLGLALVKHILNRHGGRLTIDSKPGQGATFTAVLPMNASG
jgi:two-component system phosphate regulon sensor histidine kinase PhoR